MKQLTGKIPLFSGLAHKGYSCYKAAKGRYRLKRAAARSPLRIVVGSAGVFENGWIPTDIQYLNLLDSSDWKKYFNENSVDAILSEHVWEHLTLGEGLIAAQNCFQYLKPGGYIRVAVPDGFHPDPEYIEWVRVDGTGAGADDHKVLYNYETFRNLFEKAGFQVRLLEYFDESNKFHYNDWSVDKGLIRRSRRFDERNANGELKYTSLILDATKNA
jgi:predicted SAM-dependent methyltransferase